jgi:hypothetical protein
VRLNQDLPVDLFITIFKLNTPERSQNPNGDIMKLHLLILTLITPLTLQGSGNTPILMDVDEVEEVVTVDPDAPTPRAANIAGTAGRAPSYIPAAEADAKRVRGRIPAATEVTRFNASAMETTAAATHQNQLPEAVAKRLAQLQDAITQELRRTTPEYVAANYKTLVDSFLKTFNSLQSAPATPTELLQCIQYVAAQTPPTDLNNAERHIALFCKDMMLETLCAASVCTMQEHQLKQGAEALKTALKTLPAHILERLIQISVKRDPHLKYATKCVRMRGDMVVGNNCVSKSSHTPHSPYTILRNVLQNSIASVVAEITGLPAVLGPIIMDYAPYSAAISPQDLMSYRNFDYMIIRPQHGAPFATDRANTLDLSHSGLTNLGGLHAIAQKSASLGSTQSTLGTEILHLKLNCNQLTTLPATDDRESLRHTFPQCTIIDLSNNQLTHIPGRTLPFEWIHTFLLAHNYLDEIPLDVIERAQKLGQGGWTVHMTVDLSGNPLLKKPEELKKIAELQAQGITVITDAPAASLPQASKTD